MVHPNLISDRFELKPVKSSDIENIYKGLSHPEVIRFYGVSFESMEETREQMEWYADLIKNKTGVWWTISDKESGSFLGAAGLNDMNLDKGTAEIGFWLLPENWGRGIMKEALSTIIQYSFQTLNLKEIAGFVETENSNCIRIMEKLGFTLKKTLIDAEKKGDKRISLHVYTLNAIPDSL